MYHIFGSFFNDEAEMKRLAQIYNEQLDEIKGIKSWLLMRNPEDDVSSALYVCETREDAESVKAIFDLIREKHDEDIGFNTEFIFKVVDSNF